MKKHTPAQLISLLAGPVLTVLVGLILLFNPDTASALAGKVLAWCCILAAVALGAGVVFGVPARRSRRIAWTVICAAAGIWMLRNPLTVAQFLGRILGLFLIIRGSQAASEQIRLDSGLRLSSGLVIAGATLLLGMVLVILPLATSRLVFNILGILLISVGIAQGADNLRGPKLLDEGDDPNIIDVEKL